MMNVQTFPARDPLLRKHIDFYYFFVSPDPDFNTIYYSFPNLYTPLNIHCNADSIIQPYSTTVFENPANPYHLLIQGMREYPLRVNLKGRIDKITIAFSPLGINHFLDKPFIDVAPKDSQVFEEWRQLDHYNTFLHDFYHTQDLDTRITVLEKFLLTRYRPFDQYERLHDSIKMLTDFGARHSMEDIAAATGLHLRSFNREFRKHLGISPSGFRKIARFRHSMHNRLFNEGFKRLTDIVYESDFYDQSYFISMYKKMTGSNPKKFFREIRQLGDEKLLFQFVKE